MEEIRVRVQFLGGVPEAEYLTGSCILLTYECDGRVTNILIDCGLTSGYNGREANRAMINSIDAGSIDAVVVTHPHVDHVGLIPALVRRGFAGEIITTEATAEILPLILDDGFEIQKKNRSKLFYSFDRKVEDDELYDLSDIDITCQLIKPIPYSRWFKLLNKNLAIKLYRSAHVLGGAICVVRINDKVSRKNRYIGFSGDLGRNSNMLLAPEVVEEPLEWWFSESTYGGRSHDSFEADHAKLMALAHQAKLNSLKIIIPCQSFHGVQEMIVLLSKAIANKQMPKLPIFIHSQLASAITDIYRNYWDYGESCFNRSGLDCNPFERGMFKFISRPSEAKALINGEGPMIIIASGGMCNAGPIVNYLKSLLNSKDVMLCLVGFMASHTLGAKLKNGCKECFIDDRIIDVKAMVLVFKSFVDHADAQGLVAYAKCLLYKSASGKGLRVFLNHGSLADATALKKRLLKELDLSDNDVIIAELAKKFDLIHSTR